MKFSANFLFLCWEFWIFYLSKLLLKNKIFYFIDCFIVFIMFQYPKLVKLYYLIILKWAYRKKSLKTAFFQRLVCTKFGEFFVNIKKFVVRLPILMYFELTRTMKTSEVILNWKKWNFQPIYWEIHWKNLLKIVFFHFQRFFNFQKSYWAKSWSIRFIKAQWYKKHHFCRRVKNKK